MRDALESTPNLTITEASVEDLLLSADGTAVEGVALASGEQIRGRKAIITTGTFLGGTIHLGTYCMLSPRHMKIAMTGQWLTLCWPWCRK